MNNYHSTEKPFIAKCFEASTGHINKNDDQLLKQSEHSFKEGDTNFNSVIVYSYEEGYFVFVAYDKSELSEVYKGLEDLGYSMALINLMKTARKHGCKYLQLDGDGVEYTDLPRFNWMN